MGQTRIFDGGMSGDAPAIDLAPSSCSCILNPFWMTWAWASEFVSFDVEFADTREFLRTCESGHNDRVWVHVDYIGVAS